MSIKILQTLAWFDVFNYPLRLSEIRHYTGIKIKKDLIKGFANIKQKNAFYFLEGRQKIIQNRLKANKQANQLWKKVQKWQWIFEITPFVKMVAVCNTLSFNNPDKDSDIDLFIVTKHERLFLTRTVITLLTSIFAVRRHGNKIKERFCLSFWSTEKALDFSKIMLKDSDPYLAYWIKDLKPLFGFDIHKKMLDINKTWMQAFVSAKNINSENSENNQKTSCIKKILECLLNGHLGNKLEKLLENFQLKRCKEKMKKLDKRASVITNKNMLKFHNIDMREYYKNQWLEKLSKISISI